MRNAHDASQNPGNDNFQFGSCGLPKMIVHWVTNGLKTIHGYHYQNVWAVKKGFSSIIGKVAIGRYVIPFSFEWNYTIKSSNSTYHKYGPNIWMYLINLQNQFPPVKCFPVTESMMISGSKDENATMISAMNKCKRKKYIRVKFPPLELFLRIRAKMLQILLNKVKPIKVLKIVNFRWSDISASVIFLFIFW